MPFFDSHCHLHDPRLAPTLTAVLGRAREAGVTHFLTCGTREGDWGAALDLARREAGVIPALGLHPWYAHEAAPGWLERLEALARQECVAIGECGLDFALEEPQRELQEQAFRLQLRLAKTLNRPLTIHCRRAWERLLALGQDEGLPEAGAVIHAYSGSAEVAQELQRVGFHLSFACSLAHPENRRSARAIRAVAGNRLLFETDSPDLPPPLESPETEPRLNEPAHIGRVAQAAAAHRGENPAQLTEQVHATTMRIFGGLQR